MSNGETMENMTNDTQPGMFVAWLYIIAGAIGLILSISAIAQSYITAGSAFVWLLLLAQLGAAIFGGIEVVRRRNRGYKTLYWVSLSCIPVVGSPLLTYYSAIGIGLIPAISFGAGYGGTSFLFKFGYDSSLQFLSGSGTIILGVNLAAVGLTIYLRNILKDV